MLNEARSVTFSIHALQCLTIQYDADIPMLVYMMLVIKVQNPEHGFQIVLFSGYGMQPIHEKGTSAVKGAVPCGIPCLIVEPNRPVTGTEFTGAYND